MDRYIISDNGSWEIVYTGFVLILLSFFIMLCSFSTMENAKVARFVRSFVNTLVLLPGGVKNEKSNIMIPPSVDMVNIRSELGKILQKLKTYTKQEGMEENVSFDETEKGLVMRVSDNLLFGLGNADVSQTGKPFLEKLSSLLGRYSYLISIEGHTDNLPIHSERYPSNWELSTSRAVNVLRYFIEKGGISQKRISAVGMGEFQPIVENDTPENRAKNRRVEIVLSINEDQQKSAGESK